MTFPILYSFRCFIDGFFSATPEAIAAHQARRIYCALVTETMTAEDFTVVDACSGTGVNSIQLALLGFRGKDVHK
ncbi:hypothetical protein AHF37_12720 [Paragonimus kellicotti]|nr:hypothetical protein AHF37_12720 [Paragonimus kellicotti]